MSLENTVEVTGESVDAAIRKGLEALAAAPYEVIVEVLEEPTEGYFGAEARPAKVRLKRLSMPKPPMDPTAYSAASVVENPIVFDRLPDRPLIDASAPPERRSSDNTPRPPRANENATARPSREPQANTAPSPGRDGKEGRDRSDRRTGRRGDRDARSEPLQEPSFAALAASDLPHNADYGVTDEELPMFLESALVPADQQDDEAQVGRSVLETLLEHMALTTTIEVRRAPAAEVGEAAPWVLNITGTRFASRLVGKRGETLASLQYLTRLIASRELQRRAELIIDVDGYKAKRASGLRAMALRMADDAIASQRLITLEPMPPHERRIVHLALRDHPDVSTRSVGEGRNRKVTIVPHTLAAESPDE